LLLMVFGKWSLWLVIGVSTFAMAAALAAGGHILVAAVLAIVVVVGGWYALRGDTNY
jgi:hypothetical protein